MRLNRRALLGGIAALAHMGGFPGRLLAKAIGYPRLLQGPMLGAPRTDGFTVWSRASGAFGVAVQYATDPSFKEAVTTVAVPATVENDLVTTVAVDGLKPGTDYWYRIKADGVDDRYQPLPIHARTAAVDPRRLRIAFGSCARVQLYPDQPIWDAVRAVEPDLFLWLGDNIYADSDQPAAFADLYGRQRSVTNLQPLLRSVPQLAIWDDHDFGYNDSDARNPVKAMTLQQFRRWWPNPSAGLPGTPGVFFRHSLGPVDIFMLDGRYHRSPTDMPDGPAKTMLGAGQKAWLKRELKASRATFKVLVSGTGWSSSERTGDSWAVYLHERDELLDFIRDNRIAGCFGISGDVHMGEFNCIPRSEKGGYDFYDLVSSGLAQQLSPRYVDQLPEVRLRDPFVGSHNFGLLDFAFDAQPRVEMSVRNVMGGAVWDPIVLAAADLVNGKSTWLSKIDPDELERRRRVETGGSYYGPAMK